MSRLSVMPDTERPSANELRLGKKVLDLEKERDTIAVSLVIVRRVVKLMIGRAQGIKGKTCASYLDYYPCSCPFGLHSDFLVE